MSFMPDFDPPVVAPVKEEKHIVQLREYELITPLYGGGAVAQEADPVTVVRVPSIRGQLRFWWRACRGVGTLEEMRTREADIWGMAAGTTDSDKPKRSSVNLTLSILSRGVIRPQSSFSGVDYAIFPLRPQRKDPNQREKNLVTGIRFQLQLKYPSTLDAEIRAALWAWESFGGVGARTRRGFGAIRCVAIDGIEVTPPPSVADAIKAIKDGLVLHISDGPRNDELPYLAKNAEFRLRPVRLSPQEAWSDIIARYKEFRQQRTGGTGKSPGRSLWPEPDATRTLTRQSAPAHNRPIVPGARKFPRAQFGLPIIFHFKSDKYDTSRQGDPNPDLTLQGSRRANGKYIDRFASPLLLRPISLTGGKACGLAIVLDGPRWPTGGLLLKQERHPDRVVPNPDLTPSDPEASIRPLAGTIDPLLAFLKTL